MHVDARLLRHREELVELLQPFRLEHARLHVKGAVAEKHAHAIHAQLLHPREILRVASASNCFHTCGAQPVPGR